MPGLIESENAWRKAKKFVGRIISLPLVVLCKHWRDPSCDHFPMTKHFRKTPNTSCLGKLQESHSRDHPELFSELAQPS
ncbi:hypothetical protein NPIL_146351 [Nephila pilipes]|uniref:Uncharacterized protein n=1 Tax=Nephila pilipes TaxID=299642 RepID=A0A8X6UEA7_NEPPI|nr:hypothetical protein NPIL_146351 [Nephila pilipes]